MHVPRVLSAPIAVALVTAALALAACAGPQQAVATLPDGVATSVFQGRFDYSTRSIEVRVDNQSGVAVTLRAVRLESALFGIDKPWTRGTTLSAGQAINVTFAMGEATCPAPTDDATLVTLDFGVAGEDGSATLTPADPLDQLATLTAQDCTEAAVAGHATIATAGSAAWTPGARQPLTLAIDVAPTGATGALSISAVSGTVLLALVDAAGTVIESQPVGLTIDADAAPTVIPLRIVPTRCDPHAVAEDKRGTFFPLQVEADGAVGTVYLPVTDTVRADIYAFIGDYCGY